MEIFHDTFDHHQSTKSHFEYAMGVDRVDTTQYVKKQVYRSMDLLEGWCTKHKASILIDLIFMTKPEVVVEIGVFGGKSLVPMAYALKENGKGKIYGIDPWESAKSIEGMDGVNKAYWSAVDHKAILRGLQEKIKQFDLENQIELIATTSEAAPIIEDIGLLHIDGNHSEQTSYIDVIKWVPLVKKGGVIIFDDVNWVTTNKAVKWLDDHCIKLTSFREDCIWAIWIKP